VAVSRAGFYRSLQEQRSVEEEMEVRSAIQQIAVEHRRRYGYRRIAAELRRRGMLVNHKRVDSIAVQGLVDLSLFSVGYCDQDFRQVVGGPELQGITPDQAIAQLVAHNVVDITCGCASALDEGFKFRDSLVLGFGSCEHEEVLFWKTDQADRLE